MAVAEIVAAFAERFALAVTEPLLVSVLGGDRFAERSDKLGLALEVLASASALFAEMVAA